jgi:hypothetical protein
MSRRIEASAVSANCVSSSPSIAATCALAASPAMVWARVRSILARSLFFCFSARSACRSMA